MRRRLRSVRYISNMREMTKEIALAIRFQEEDEGLDRIFDMLASKSVQFTGGGCGRIILPFDHEDEEIPPVLEPLLLGLAEDDLDFGQDMVGYIRNVDRSDITTEQAENLKAWFDENAGKCQIGNLVNLWEEK